MDFKEYKAKVFAERPGVKEEYDALAPQYEIIRAEIESRRAIGMTQKQLAEKMGTAQANISRFESGTYNPSLAFLQKMADSLGKLTGLPVVNLANKVRDLGPQEDKTYDERFADMAGIFEIAAKPKPNVLIVDDVKTTGATLNEMTKVLRENGCENVYCLTFASNVRKIPME